ncbi:MAG: protein-tyrosine-phosphatase [Dyadobacter sp.]
MTRPNILVICGRNKRRSRTAEHIFKNDSRFNVRSAGLSPQSNRKISENDLHWADLVLVMEADQKTKIRKVYQYLELPSIEVLNIADDYEFMDDELVEALTVKMNALLDVNFEL